MENIITALEPQRKNPDRINVFIDDQFAFGVSRFVGAWLKKGDKLADVKIKQLLDQDNHEKALQQALRFIAYQPRSVSEVYRKLEKAEFDSLTIDAVISELEEKKYLDDERFAVDWIESRCVSKPRSHKFYSMELRRKGISEENINKALKIAPPDEDLAFALGEKYIRRYSHLDESEFKKKVRGVLSRRAFSYEIIKTTIKELVKNRNTGK
jgi:regulatory protein